ncbi:major facilitator superfamily MFS_1 [alpha proteobacterium U9-1i]|nr:major facilitator superfamily MFS_1 [alpha proteobacterium U9-1i]
MTAHTDTTPTREFRDGWPVIFCAVLGLVVTNFHVYSLTIFIEPLEQAFGWTRTQITSATIVSAIVGVIGYPLVGILLDRIGARNVALLGMLIFCPALALLSQVGPELYKWWIGYALVNIGHVMAGITVWTSGVASRFDKKRGLALGISLTGAGIATATLPTVANALVERFGWDGAYIGLGLIAAVLILPATFFLFHDRRSLAAKGKKGRAVNAWTPEGVTVAQALRTVTFWQLLFAALFLIAALLGLIVHFVPMLTEEGVPRTTAAAIAGLIGLSSVAGRLISGFLIDRVHARFVGGSFSLLPAIACTLVLFSDGEPLLWYPAAISFGLALGAEADVLSYSTTRYFGLKSYGVLFGLYAATLTTGAGIGPVLGGLIHDRTGTYDLLVMSAIGISLLASLLMFMLSPYPAAPAQERTVGAAEQPA